MKIYKFASVAILSIMPSLVNALPGQWMPDGKKITEIIIQDTDSVLVALDGGVPADYLPTQCSSPYSLVSVSTDKGRATYSLLLAAYMSGKPVKFALSCQGPYPYISYVRF